MAKVSTILDWLDMGSMALPEFQRGYVWNREQVRGLMHSMYKGHPVGSLLVWETPAIEAPARGAPQLAPGVVKLLLDGQQRMTTLYGVIRGKAPQFFDGNTATFTGLFFHLESEEFEFYGPIKMAGDPLWIDVTDLMVKGNGGLGTIISRLSADPGNSVKVGEYSGRLARLLAIRDTDLHMETVTGMDKSIDIVVEIFNKVNSGGTKLSKGDLALARICVGWGEARAMMKKALARWQAAGFIFDLDWLLRNMNAILNGEARFQFLHKASPNAVKEGLGRAEKSVDTVLNAISGRLGLDTDQVLFGKGALPLLTHYVDRCGGKFKNAIERDRLLLWYIQSAIRGRYSGSTESVLDRDLHLIEDIEKGLDRLITELLLAYGTLRVVPDHFSGWSLGARFYPVLYMLSRMCGARDLESGLELKQNLLGKQNTLQVHHIFPKAQLYAAKSKYSRSQVNAVSNFCFLTKGTNLSITDKPPEEYFQEIERNYPGALASQWIPMDKALWKIENYLDFLEVRKALLAEATNSLMGQLYHGELPERIGVAVPVVALPVLRGSIADAEEETELEELNSWVQEQGLPPGSLSYEMVDSETGEAVVVLDLAWPNGLQAGLSKPIAVLLNEAADTILLVNRNGYFVFTKLNEFKKYVREQLSENAGVSKAS